MVRTTPTGQLAPRFERHSPVSGDPLYEFSTFRSFRAQVGVDGIARRERIAFDLLIAPTRGRGSHEVDFQTTHLDRNHWLYVRAGQVHRWGPVTYEADLVVLQPVTGAAHWQPGPHRITFTDPQLAELRPLLDFAKVDRTNPDPVVMEVTRDLLFEWLQRGATQHKQNPLHAGFQNLLELHVVDMRSVDDYAVILGVTRRELADACRSAGGRHPQKMIDDALLLEAKRLFAQSNATVPAVASFLGFDTHSFDKFFRRAEGQRLDRWLSANLT